MHQFIVITGNNGTGKSTIVASLQAQFDAATLHYPEAFVRFRRQARLDTDVAPVPRLLSYVAASLWLADEVGARRRHRPVICDRYLESPLSLIEAEVAMTRAEVTAVVDPLLARFSRPDAIVLLRCNHGVARERILDRSNGDAALTRTQQLVVDDADFFRRREVSLAHWSRRCGPVTEIDTTLLSIDEMGHAAADAVAHLWPIPAPPQVTS